jgi:DNA/RNA endonuclease G (NUC1)
VTIPLQIELSVEVAAASLVSEPTSGPELIEKMVEPIHDPIEAPRAGYDKDFIGAEVPMPRARRPDECVELADGSTRLDYHHFSVVMNRERRIALFTAANVDGSKAAKEPEPGYKYTRAGLTGLVEGDVEKWYGDPRIRGVEQLPDRFFNKDRKAFDKGHLVRREDVAWGKSFEEVRAANGDTYFVTNCSPQTAGFNRSNRRDNWGALEDLVLSQAANERYCLFSGPVLGDDDPDFTGVDDLGGIVVKIPRKYWKVVVANSPEGLRLFAFVLEQDLADTPMEFAVPESWLPHMIRLSELEKELGSLDFDQRLHDADQHDLVQAITAIEALRPAIVEALPEAAAGHGRFIGLPASVTFDNLNESRRSAHLLSPISYFDPAESEWPVPSGAWLDGASIPRAFWTLIGSPFTGRYLEPSMVHDHYCITRNRPWRDTHRMFHEAMLCRGVSGFKAKVMFYAVYRFGPRWVEPGVEGTAEAPSAPEALTNEKAQSILADAAVLAKEDLSLDDIERMVDQRQSGGSPASTGNGTGRTSRSQKSKDELV